MKRIFSILIVLLLIALPVVCSASSWPPPAYDMPRSAVDASSFTGFVNSIKASAGAIVNTGFVIFGICVSVRLIFSIFSRVTSTHIDTSSSHAPADLIESSKRLDGFHRSSPPMFLFHRSSDIDYESRLFSRQSRNSRRGGE